MMPLAGDPAALFDDPCGRGWIACLCVTRLEEEIGFCRPRRVLLVNADDATAADQSDELARLGCRVGVAEDRHELLRAVGDAADCVLALDAASLGERGPELAREVNALSPSLRIVVFGSAGCHGEAAYRSAEIFYYAVEPFVDGEIVAILDAAFKCPARVARRIARQGHAGAAGRHAHHQSQRAQGATAGRAGPVAAERRPRLPDPAETAGPGFPGRDDRQATTTSRR